MRVVVRLLGLALLGGWLAPVWADEPPTTNVVGLNGNASRRLDEARQKAERKQFQDALDDYQALLNSVGNDLVPLSDNHLVPVRWACQRGIAALPAAGLRAYRQRVDAQARRLLEQAGDPGDERLLRRVVDDFFCSSPAEAALHRLGDRAFERGQFDEAERWWRLLLPAEGDGPTLSYPAPDGDPALVEARILLARWFRGPDAAWRADLEAFRKKHPGSDGNLGGRTGKLTELLGELTREAYQPVDGSTTWTTFAGAPGRSLVLPDEPTRPTRLARLAREGRQHSFPLGTAREPGRGKILAPAEAARSLAFHPLLLDRKAVVCDARQVVAFDLQTGGREVWYDARKFLGNFEARLELPAPADLGYTLSAAQDCVLARLGTQALGGNRADSRSCLVCLNRRAGTNRIRWQVKPGQGAVFEGTPVIHGRLAYVAVSRFSSGQVVTAVHGYPLDAEGEPSPRWQRDLFKGRDGRGAEGRSRHHLLTVAGPNVVCCTHTGAILALDRETGRRAWAWAYTSHEEVSPARGLACCAAAEGRVFAAPADLKRLLCLDAATGKLLWQRDGIEVGQILGVGSGRLIFTTRTPRAGLRAVEVANGTDEGGWFQPGDGGSLPTFGQGFLAGDRVYWPTVEGVHALDQASGAVSGDPTCLRLIPSGNLVAGEGCLAVADRTTLHVFTPPSWEIDERKKEVEQGTRSGLGHYRLGVAQREAARFTDAEQSFLRARELARPGDWAGGRRLRDQAHQARHETLLDAASWHGRRQQWDQAADLLRTASSAEFAPPERLAARQRLVDLWERAGRPEQAVAACQAILESKELRPLAGPWASQRLDALLAQHGRAAYAAVEKRAAEAPAVASRLERLRRLAHDFPHADLTFASLRELAEAEEKEKAPGRAAAACRLWLRQQSRRGGASGAEKARVEADLKRLCDAVCVSKGPGQVALELPLERSWQETAAEPLILSSSTAYFCATGEGRVVGRASSGKKLFAHGAARSPEWVGQHADIALTGRSDGVTALTLRGGHVLWERPGASLTGFRAGGGRLYCLAGSRRLVALDAETGQECWTLDAPASFRPRPLPGGRFEKVVRATAELVFVRLGDGTVWKVDAASGRRLSSEPPSRLDQVRYCNPQLGKVCWTHTIPARTTLDGRTPRLVTQNGQVLVLISRNYGEALQRLDVATGKPIWDREVLFATGGVLDAGSFSVDDQACYLAHDGALAARSLDDGRERWRLPLPGRTQRWRTCRAGDWVLAWPAEVTAARFLFRSPLGSLEWRLGLAPEDRPREGFPVLCVQAQSGKLAQRLNLPVRSGPLSFQARGWWQQDPLVPSVRPEVAVHPGGLTVFVGGQAFGFESAASRP